MCNINHPTFPCRICAKSVHEKDAAVQYDLCEISIHIKCNKLNYLDYKYLQNCGKSWYYIECCSKIFPTPYLATKTSWLVVQTLKATSLILLQEIVMTLKKLLHLNMTLKINNIEIPHKNKSLSLFHINAYSHNKNFDDLQHLLSCTKTKFDIIAISETRITKQVSLLNNLNLNNYSFEFTPTETSAGGTLLYIANHLSYKCRNDLNIYKKNELESTFIEIVNPKKSNIIVGVIYRHPSMDLTDFNCSYLNKLLENISKE